MTAPTRRYAVVKERSYQLFIDGRWQVPQSEQHAERRYPGDPDMVVATFPVAGEADVDLAVRAARSAFDRGDWARAPARQRATVLRRAAAKLREESEPLGALLSSEVGKPITDSLREVALSADVLEYYAGLALDIRGQAISTYVDDALGLILKEPVGVVAIITPWNSPLLLAVNKAAPALAAGCTIVLKPASYTPCSSYELGRIIGESGAPPGVINVVSGPGGATGLRLAESPLVDAIAFTGSTAVGREIMQAAAGTVKEVSLELGGKSPNVIFSDADLDRAVPMALYGIYMGAGQVCAAGSRVLVQGSVHDEFLARFNALMDNLRLGDPMDPDTGMGPLVSEQQLGTVESFVESGRQDRASLLRGGRRRGDGALARGYYYEPTIFDRVKSRMKIAQEEIFGPVLSVIPFEDMADALRVANETIYGLASAVWTNDIDKALRFAKGIRAGTVWVNCYYSAGIPQMPMGGYKQSGIGRELGQAGLERFLETKSVSIKLG